MKYNRRLNKDQIEKIKKKKQKRHNEKRYKKFKDCRCIICGSRTKHHHNYCDKHYHLQSL